MIEFVATDFKRRQIKDIKIIYIMSNLDGEMPRKRVKTVPVKIVPNSSREGAPAAPPKFKQCKLHFDVGPPSESGDGAITNA
jgi:hypothetical protein